MPYRTPFKLSAAQLPVSSRHEQSYKVCNHTQLTTPHNKLKQHNTGVGVGNAEASPTNALLLHILQDTSGRIATILFAHRVGTALEPECKTYRLAADVFNDIAMIMDCLSPMVPAGMIRVSVLSTAGILRALCGVAGGSSKASLSAHFAKWGNLAELNAVRYTTSIHQYQFLMSRLHAERFLSRNYHLFIWYAGTGSIYITLLSTIITVSRDSRLVPSLSHTSPASKLHGQHYSSY